MNDQRPFYSHYNLNLKKPRLYYYYYYWYWELRNNNKAGLLFAMFTFLIWPIHSNLAMTVCPEEG